MDTNRRAESRTVASDPATSGWRRRELAMGIAVALSALLLSACPGSHRQSAPPRSNGGGGMGYRRY